MKKRFRQILKYGGIGGIITSAVLYGIITLYVRTTYEETPQTLDSFTSLPNTEQELVRIGDAAVQVDVVRTPEAIRRGLGGRDTLQEDTGMLFIFPDMRMREFWMKDMHVAIDIIWIREGRIIGVTEYVLPEPGVSDTFLRRYASPGSVDMVLEVQAGWSEIHEISSGMTVKRESL
jgi:uncharacterized protein